MTNKRFLLTEVHVNTPSEEELNAAKEVIAKYENGLLLKVKKSLIVCPECNHSQEIQDSLLLQYFDYEFPYNFRALKEEANCNNCGKSYLLPIELQVESEFRNKKFFKDCNEVYN